ncbi:RNA dependent RNA polymerase-domain-containing protein [Suillus paluster]|uniref:RNA dependent RNA polymerase-domain-containing protein n=1 Tax=Suillus paluster TaxID=48578 RepID=UPI001B860193|nr:RNA dependent RNA polymerase-domain-containing protein [Suillus paluster]KAG1724765.1 RNA dependent RNA polymerase-domain-containing protein [Suillus paluster]
MEFIIRNVDFGATEYDVTKAIAEVLHACPGPFVSDADAQQRLINFRVTLDKNECGGVRNSGSGTLRLPSKSVGLKFCRLVDVEDGITIKVGKKCLKFRPTTKHIPNDILITLAKAPYVDPDIAQKRQEKIDALSSDFRIATVQIGTFYRPQNALPLDPRAFSVEWERDLVDSGLGWLKFEYEHKLIRAKVGDPARGQLLYSLIIKFVNINKMAVGYDFGNQYICFDLFTPPIIEREDVNRTLTGTRLDSQNYRDRIGALHPGHEQIAPYAHHIRIILSEPGDLDKFKQFCRIAELRPPIDSVFIEATRQEFFTSRKLALVQKWLESLSSNWPVAFQIEALLRNGIANTKELEDLRPRINELIRRHQPSAAAIMRFFVIRAASRPPGQTIQTRFEQVLQGRLGNIPPEAPPGRFYCHHVTVTPTRLILEGPNIMQSNRVIREYEGYEGNFIRVDFRDEDRLQYRWDREVDGASFVRHRVGEFLKNGFKLAGKHFDFLAYSQSALREHAVWFVSSFQHAAKGPVNAHTIRSGLGDFSGCIFSPSKYAARMAQAFTATDPSVEIHRSQWSEMPDIVENNVTFSDGVGTISEELGDKIWEILRSARRDGGAYAVKPSAYQIRFLGYKGVVAIDKELQGIQICLRESMNKFKDHGQEYAMIEIARPVVKPNIPHLNRPLITVLEDRGASKETFMDLQRKVVAEARTAHDSVDIFARLLESHGLSQPFRLASALRKLNTLGLELKPTLLQRNIDTPFLAQIRYCAINHVLRAVKHDARIPIPNSYMLMGVTDEGPAYEKRGRSNVFKLAPGKIYACVQKPGDNEPIWLHGPCMVSRSPVIHPGDVQQAYAIGKPPTDKLCLFAHLKNVVVFSSTGTTCLANSLGGGDLDGDLYEIIQHPLLILPDHHDPASYPSRSPFKIDQPSTIDDVCDFVVEYINSDVVGLVSSKHIIIAGNVCSDGTFNERCLKLAELHSQAVDYPKNGLKVDMEDIPRNLIPYKPDWHAAEVESPRPTDYYESDRALGHLYRNIQLEEIPPYHPQQLEKPLSDLISVTLRPLVERQLERRERPSKLKVSMDSIYSAYLDELIYVATCHTLSRVPGARLREDEIVVGTILAKCSQKSWKSNRTYAMRECISVLVHDIRRRMLPDSMESASPDDLRDGLENGWSAWAHSHEKSNSKEAYGAQSFGLVALGVVLDCLEKLQEISLPPA